MYADSTTSPFPWCADSLALASLGALLAPVWRQARDRGTWTF